MNLQLITWHNSVSWPASASKVLLKDSSRFGGENEEPGVRGGGVKETVELKAAGGEKVEEEPELKLKCLVKTPGLP